MHRWLFQIFAIAGGSVIYWQIVTLAGDVTEPWDAPLYWTVAYPLSVAISGIIGWLLRRRGWIAGAIVNLAQLPVMVLNNDPNPLWAVGLFYLMLLTIPSASVSALMARLASRRRHS